MTTEAKNPEGYAARSVCTLGLWEEGGWRMKVYGIAYRGNRPSEALVAAAKAIASRDLPLPATAEARAGVGFIGAHEGRGANLVFLGWWANENELHLLVYTAGHDDPLNLLPAAESGLKGCVWDLTVIGFERKAWIATALFDPAYPDLDAYLATRFEGAV